MVIAIKLHVHEVTAEEEEEYLKCKAGCLI